MKSDQSGSVAIMFGVGCICFFVLIGLSVDTARYYNLATKIQDSLDAATLAGAKHLDDDSMTDDQIVALTRANFVAAIKSLGVATQTAPTINIVVDRVNSSVKSTSDMTVRSLFGPLVMLPQYVPVARTSKVVYDMKHVELSMVLDITGSMNAKNKISDMKAAATDIVDELLTDSINENSIRISVAPYSASVNAGQYVNSVASVVTSYTCSWYFGVGCKTAAGVGVDTCVIERSGSNALTDVAPIGLDKLAKVTTLPFGNYMCPDATVIPLSGKSQKDQIKSTINGYVAGGSTAGHIGTAWGWYLLSPSWSSVFPSASAPGAYGDSKVNKTVLIMTDGLFNTSYKSGPASNAATMTNESYSQFQSLCSGMKAKGINIYTVGFDLSDPNALSQLQTCATSPANFFDAKTGNELKAAFKAIAAKLNTLRVAS